MNNMKENVNEHTSGRIRPLAFILAALCLLGWQNAMAATLATDKPDYYPGDHVTFTGTGWAPGETVYISVWESTSEPDIWIDTVSTVASSTVPSPIVHLYVQQSFLGLGFLAQAVGETSKLEASTTFTDANITCAGAAVEELRRSTRPRRFRD